MGGGGQYCKRYQDLFSRIQKPATSLPGKKVRNHAPPSPTSGPGRWTCGSQALSQDLDHPSRGGGVQPPLLLRQALAAPEAAAGPAPLLGPLAHPTRRPITLPSAPPGLTLHADGGALRGPQKVLILECFCRIFLVISGRIIIVHSYDVCPALVKKLLSVILNRFGPLGTHCAQEVPI